MNNNTNKPDDLPEHLKTQDPLALTTLNQRVSIPAYQLPFVRLQYATQDGVEKSYLYHCWGGL